MTAAVGQFSGASPQAIQYHYDAGSQFFRLWLGPTMAYSAARYDETGSQCITPDALDHAQESKLSYHLMAVGMAPGMRLLDVGCGWGGVLLRAVTDFRLSSAIGLTLSKDQYQYVRQNSLPGMEVRLQSYEHFEPQKRFHGIVSIGAFEHFSKPTLSRSEKIAVYGNFFSRCHQWLEQGGRLSLQTIAWGDVREQSRKEITIQEFFPDSDLPYVSEIFSAAAPYFEVLSLENRRRDYELTLRSWLANLRSHKAEALTLVGPQRYSFYERCCRGGARLFQARKYYLCRFVFRRLTK